MDKHKQLMRDLYLFSEVIKAEIARNGSEELIKAIEKQMVKEIRKVLDD